MPTPTRKKQTNSAESRTGRYTQGGLVDRFQTRLGWWERVVYEKSNDDITVVVDSRTAGRPDLIAYDLYGQAKLMWFVLQFNNIVDINEELVAGKRLRLPTPARLQSSVLTHPSGGNRV